MTFTTYASWFQNAAGMAEQLPFQTRADYESYLARLAAFPVYNDAYLDVTRRGVKEGYAQPCVPLMMRRYARHGPTASAYCRASTREIWTT